ncbi:two-component system sensor histidine kinase KdpD [Providencia burhodogranariea]|uniref:histidine kinase n=1 Tax=Providencia burhodogranariea DSM 19968 TaxID=1141662 RepID=K8WMB8_9GAMM|nr:sensor protein KdpD [Providencia burhodogranariea DSM 19968]
MDNNDPVRPNPDDLLVKANDCGRGKLKIFFGACAGVGKTYAMLQEAQRLRNQGLDVLVGVVETHEREETAALLEGLTLLAPRRLHNRTRRVQHAFDIDAAIARHPAIILMDELAFSNPTGSRHPKRWQDIEELLDAGIDVLTTINVQHIESLNDVVGSITGIRVRETVPDHIFDAADEIVLVDLPPDDLRQRLKEGKVYIPGQAERAIEHFFRKGNLIALRELALRRTADRVDGQMREFRDGKGLAPVWHTRDGLLLCIGHNRGNEKLVRAAARLAAKLGSVWHAVYVETPKLHGLPEGHRRAILKVLRLAQDLGAETATLSDPSEEKAILRYAREHNLGKILIGRRTKRRKWLIFNLRSSFAERLGELGPDLDLVIVALEEKNYCEKEPEHKPFSEKWRTDVNGFVMAIVMCAVITLFSHTFLLALDKANLVTLYLLGVVLVALFYGRRPSVFAALVNVISFDLFFVQPHFSLAIMDMQYLVTFTVMLIVGVVVGNLTAGMRYQARIARYREQRTRHLYEMTKELSQALTEQDVGKTGYHFINNAFQAKTCLLLLDDNNKLSPLMCEGYSPMQIDQAIAKWSFDKRQPAGAGTDTLPSVPYQLQPITTADQTIAVLAIEPSNIRQLLIPEQQRMLQTFTGLIASALARLQLTKQAETAKLDIEREQLRNSLLAALSHDLKTPLTILFGQTEILMLDLSAENSRYTEQVSKMRQQVLSTSRLVNNLLDMARLQSGGIQLNLEWQSLEEITGSAVRTLDYTLKSHPLSIDIPADLLLYCDANLIERVLINLLENAIKYSDDNTPMGICAKVEGNQVHIEVWDANNAIPDGQEKTIFDKFSRAQKESAIPGVGLGLAICRAIIQLHEGQIWAENNKKGGASFHFILPFKQLPDIEEITDYREPPSNIDH